MLALSISICMHVRVRSVHTMPDLQEIVDNCLLDKYNPYTGVTVECAQIDPNITCYGMFDGSNSIMASLVVVFVSLAVVLL